MSEEYVVRIKDGAKISQDMRFVTWPECFPPQSEYPQPNSYRYRTIYPDALFVATKDTKGTWFCRRDGYGILSKHAETGDYGNGSIFVHKDWVEVIGKNYKAK